MAAFDNTTEIYPDNDFPPGENPLSDGGKWYSWARFPLQSKGDGSAIIGTEEFAVNGSMYVAETFNGNIIEAYGCRPESGLGAALESHRIVALTDPVSYVGYSSGFGGGITESYFFRKYSGSTGTWDDIAGDVIVDFDPQRPSKLGIRITPSTVEQWGFYTAVGDTTEDWHLVQYSNDTSIRGTFYIGLETEEQGGVNEVGWTCFGAQVIRRTQFYRWLPSLKAGELV